MAELFKIHRYFFILTFLFLIAGALMLLWIPKGQIEIWINGYHNHFLDILFQGVTFLGDGIFSFLFVLFMFFRKIFWGIVSGCAILFTTVITQGLKHFVFADALRPYKFFESTLHLYYIDGLHINSFFSFPSGHTSGAFTIFFFLAMTTRKQYMDIFCFFISLLVGISRMYLLQHFFEDVYCGALIGIAGTFITVIYFMYFTELSSKPALDRPLFQKAGI